jgi:hypothetical protein
MESPRADGSPAGQLADSRLPPPGAARAVANVAHDPRQGDRLPPAARLPPPSAMTTRDGDRLPPAAKLPPPSAMSMSRGGPDSDAEGADGSFRQSSFRREGSQRRRTGVENVSASISLSTAPLHPPPKFKFEEASTDDEGNTEFVPRLQFSPRARQEAQAQSGLSVLWSELPPEVPVPPVFFFFVREPPHSRHPEPCPKPSPLVHQQMARARKPEDHSHSTHTRLESVPSDPHTARHPLSHLARPRVSTSPAPVRAL